jgi:hypothetical protein
VERLIELFLYRWQTATPTDYAHCVITIIVLAWFASKVSKS